MTDQLSFGMARNTDPQTSHDAAAITDVNRLEAIVLRIIRSLQGYGATAKDISRISEIPLNSISPRTAPLQRKGMIVNSGKKRQKCIVWLAKEHGV